MPVELRRGSAPPCESMWHVAQEMLPSPESAGSWYSRRPSSILSRSMDAVASSGIASKVVPTTSRRGRSSAGAVSSPAGVSVSVEASDSSSHAPSASSAPSAIVHRSVFIVPPCL